MSAASIEHVFALALRHHQAGQLAEAEGLYRQILAARPDHAGAWHHFGIVAQQKGRPDLAVEWISRAIAMEPNNAAAHSNLGEAYRSRGYLVEAMGSFRRALELKPDSAAAHYNLANALRENGRTDEAVASYRRALELQADYPEAHLNLGGVLAAQGKLEEAITHYRRALELRPGYAEACNNLGLALAGLGRPAEAVEVYRRAIELEPQDADTHYNLGNAFWDMDAIDEAEAAFRAALRIEPLHALAYNNQGRVLQRRGELVDAMFIFRRVREQEPNLAAACTNLGSVLTEMGQPEAALHAYRDALKIEPNSAEAHSNVGFMLRELGRLDEAMAEYGQALELKPDSPKMHLNLAGVLKDEGRLEEAIGEYRRALELDPTYREAHSSLIYTLHLLPGVDGSAIAEEHRRWNERFAEPLRRAARPHANDRDPERRLRVGYVSADFRAHPVAYFMASLLKAHDRRQIEIRCYASVQHRDAMTDHLRVAAGDWEKNWRDVRALSDAQLAEQVREDGIDILVDLGLHTAHNRLGTFARKPAPVQVSWLGYPASSGLGAMDYRLTDGWLEPEGCPWSASVERPIRLPETWCCFTAIDHYPAPGFLPAGRSGHVTFGSLNNFCKVNEGVLRLWARVLQAVADSRLLMQCPAGATQTRVWGWFEAHGIAADRVELVSRTAGRGEFLRLFERIDIALDPFPYNGGTTTFEALWMGIPVVSLAGSAALGRVGLSALTNIGLPGLVASSEDEYVQIAARLAGDLARVEGLRGTLRGRMEVSPLMDAPRFAGHMEGAFRAMWREWCAGKASW